MKLKTVAVLLVVMMMFTPMLFAGGAAESEQQVSAPVTTLEFWTWRPEDVDFYASQIAIFEARNPGIKVVQTAQKNTEYNTILAASLSGGAGPDIFQGRAYGGLATFADSLKSYSASSLLGATSPTDGKIYGSPAVSQTVFMYYNKAVYQELGLSIPTTWSQLLANFDAMEAAGYLALGNGAKDGWTLETMLGGMGPAFGVAHQAGAHAASSGSTSRTGMAGTGGCVAWQGAGEQGAAAVPHSRRSPTDPRDYRI